MSIWVAWHKNRPENYVLGKTKQEVAKLIQQNPRMDCYHMLDGTAMATSPDYPGLEGKGTDVRIAMDDLLYKINLTHEVVTWERVIMKIVRNEFLEPCEQEAVEALKAKIGET